MTRQEYLAALQAELCKANVADVDDIVAEYEQHFLFKLADGYTEEEIATKLGAPEQIAVQFAGLPGEKKNKGGRKALLVIWLTIIGIFEALLYCAFFCFIVALFCASLIPAALGVELFAGFNIMNILPPIPSAATIVFGIMLVSLGVLLFVAAIYCFAYLRQMVRASLRWRKNMLRGETLPALPLSPQFSPKGRRAIRRIFLWSLLIFGTTFIAGYTLLVLSTQAWEFWHALGWFGYTGG